MNYQAPSQVPPMVELQMVQQEGNYEKVRMGSILPNLSPYCIPVLKFEINPVSFPGA